MGDWADRLESRLGEMEKNIIREVGELRSKVDKVNDKLDQLSAKVDKILEPPTWRCVYTLTGHSSSVNSVAISRNGQTLASGGDSTIKLWNLNNGQEICTLTGHSDEVSSIAFSPDGQT